MTTRCVMESTLCQATICPAGMVEGFGENDWDPLTATTLIVTAVPGTGDGVGLEVLPELLQPQTPRLRTATASAAEYLSTTNSFSLTTRVCGTDADQRGLHLAVTASAELRTGNLVAARCRRREYHRHRIAAFRHLHIDLQLRNREAVHTVRRSDHDPHGLAGVHLNRDRIEGIPTRRDLDVVNRPIRGGRAPHHEHGRQRRRSAPSNVAHDAHATRTCPVIFG